MCRFYRMEGNTAASWDEKNRNRVIIKKQKPLIFRQRLLLLGICYFLGLWDLMEEQAFLTNFYANKVANFQITRKHLKRQGIL